MKSESINNIKKKLLSLEPNELTLICLRLAKYKKESKELLSYLVFDSKDESQYVANVQQYCTEMIQEIKQKNSYIMIKNIRKTAKLVHKYMKFTENEVSKLEILIFFIELVKPIINRYNLMSLDTFYVSQYKKMEALFNKLHEDYQYDFKNKMEELRPEFYY